MPSGASGMSFDQIAGTLNEEGIKPRRRGKWGGFAINRILKAEEASGRG